MAELFVKSGELDIWTESFGDISSPAILLIFGSGCQGILWPDDFCDKLAQTGFFVIRYDHRDTGLSSLVDYDVSPYSLGDMADDAIALLDCYGIAKAHIVGASMGGMIGQLLAIDYPDRVGSLISISSSPGRPLMDMEVKGPHIGEYVLPPPTSDFLVLLAVESEQKMVSREDYIAQEVRIWRACNGEGIDFDEAAVIAQQTLAFNRININNASAAENHIRAMVCSSDRSGCLAKITAPTLVIHGDKDPLLPLEHGIATAERIPNARLEIIENMGHIFPFARSDYLQKLIVEHIVHF